MALLHDIRGRQLAKQVELGSLWQNTGHVFTQADGTPVEPSEVTDDFATLVREAGLPHLTLHGLRHAHATLLLTAGIPDLAVSRRLGHSNISTTLDIYGHLLPELEERAGLAIDCILAGD